MSHLIEAQDWLDAKVRCSRPFEEHREAAAALKSLDLVAFNRRAEAAFVEMVTQLLEAETLTPLPISYAKQRSS